MTTLSLSRARAALGDAVNSVAYGRERVVIERHGRAVAAIVSMDDLELIRRLEDDALGREAIRRLQDRSDRVVSNQEAMKELGLDRSADAARPRRPRKRSRRQVSP